MKTTFAALYKSVIATVFVAVALLWPAYAGAVVECGKMNTITYLAQMNEGEIPSSHWQSAKNELADLVVDHCASKACVAAIEIESALAVDTSGQLMSVCASSEPTFVLAQPLDAIRRPPRL